MSVAESPRAALGPRAPVGSRRLRVVESAALAGVSLIALVILAAWLVPGVAGLLPDGWALMQATTALSALFLAVALALTARPGRGRLAASRVLAGVVITLGGVVLSRHLLGEVSGLAAGWVAADNLPRVHTMSAQSALSFVLAGAATLIRPTAARTLGYLLDGLASVLVALCVLFLSAHLFHAMAIVGISASILMSPQTVASVSLLTVVLMVRRAPHGFLSVLTEAGVAGHLVRVVLPVALVFILGSALLEERLVAADLLSPPEAVSVLSSIISVALAIIIVMMARKVLDMERALRELSMTDELTGVHNRRGFFLLAAQARRDARRTNTSQLLIFLDVDGLKPVNDTLGHEAGSRLLRDLGGLLRRTFRDNDIIGRVGGDEFALLIHGRPDDEPAILRRLREAAEAVNTEGDAPYRIAFSVGVVPVPPDRTDTLEALIDRADVQMYAAKREKRER